MAEIIAKTFTTMSKNFISFCAVKCMRSACITFFLSYINGNCIKQSLVFSKNAD